MMNGDVNALGGPKAFYENDSCEDVDGESQVCRVVQSHSNQSDSKTVLDGDSDDCHGIEWTPFLRACRYGQTDIVVQLLSNGVDPYVCDSLGWNAVPLAVASGNLETLKEILKAVKWKRKDLAPALCLCALNGDCKTAEILFSFRASANVPIEDFGITPLMLASGEGNVEMISLLLNHGADPDMTNALHQTALDAAVIRNQITVQNILGPITHLRSKISSHIPLPTSPPNRALQSPNTIQPDIRFLGASPFMGDCRHHNPGFGSSPMLHCVQLSTPASGPFCSPWGSFLASYAALQNKGHLSPFPASYSSLVPSFNVSQCSPANCLTPLQSQCCGACQNITGSYQNISGNIDEGHNQKSISKRNKRLRKWWHGMKKRYVGDQLDKNEELFNENKNLDLAMEKRLANFLRSIKMSEYHTLFTAQEVDFETFLTLTEEDMEEIGVKNPAHRSKIVQKIKKFSMHANNF